MPPVSPAPEPPPPPAHSPFDMMAAMGGSGGVVASPSQPQMPLPPIQGPIQMPMVPKINPERDMSSALDIGSPPAKSMSPDYQGVSATVPLAGNIGLTITAVGGADGSFTVGAGLSVGLPSLSPYVGYLEGKIQIPSEAKKESYVANFLSGTSTDVNFGGLLNGGVNVSHSTLDFAGEFGGGASRSLSVNITPIGIAVFQYDKTNGARFFPR